MKHRKWMNEIISMVEKSPLINPVASEVCFNLIRKRLVDLQDAEGRIGEAVNILNTCKNIDEVRERLPEIKQLLTEPDERHRLFVDMDGTLAVFKNVDHLEQLLEQGYFLNLEPQEQVVDAVKEIISSHPDIEVYIMSSVLSDSKYAVEEKNAWLNKYLPEIPMDHRIFPPCGDNKLDYVPDGIRTSDCLLDDYTKNLVLWEPPAKGIKLLNGINHTHGSWKGNKLSYDTNASDLALEISQLVKKSDKQPGLKKQVNQKAPKI